MSKAKTPISASLLRWLRRIATEPEKVSNADAQLHQKDAQAILVALGRGTGRKRRSRPGAVVVNQFVMPDDLLEWMEAVVSGNACPSDFTTADAKAILAGMRLLPKTKKGKQ